MDKKINSIEKITTSVEDINKRLDRIEKTLIKLEELLNPILDSSQHMNNHIEFIETIYDGIKQPFHFIMDRVSNISLMTYIDNDIIQYIEEI